MYGAQAGHREFVTKRRVWQFGLMPDEVAPFVEPYGWRQVEQLGPQEFSSRYVHTSGREMPVSEIERTVYCVKGGA